MFKKAIFTISILFLISCSNNSNITLNNNVDINKLKNDKSIYKNIINNIQKNKLDNADDFYVELKTKYEDSRYIDDAAISLALAHMKIKENILANFYIQEALNSNRSNQVASYLLARNQFEAAAKIRSDKSYLEKAIEAIKSNKSLINNQEHSILTDSMLLRLQFEKIYNDIKISQLYKNLNKQEAYRLYNKKAQELGIDIKKIYKP